MRKRKELRRLLLVSAALVLFLITVSVAHAQASTPTVSTVAITSTPGADNTYNVGDTITVSLTFSEAVTVAGKPHVTLDIGGQPRNVAYSGDGSSAAAQPFSYAVLVGDEDTDGVSLQANSLTLNGGTIRAIDDSTDASLTHSAMTFASDKIDNDITLVSNIEQTDASTTITISATESATVSFSIPLTDRKQTLNEIVLDVKTASPTLDVTIQVFIQSSIVNDLFSTQLFSGSVASVGRQIFTPNDPHLSSHAKLRRYNAISTFGITISGTGGGAVELGATASGGEDRGLSNWRLANPSPSTTIPRLSLQGHEYANPFIFHAEIISAPEDGVSYKAGERIEALFIFSDYLQGTMPVVAELWLGTGAEYRRTASLVTHFPSSAGHNALYAYTVQDGDEDTDGILLGENPLGRNENGELTLEFQSQVPADLTLPALQLGAGQLVDGSQEQTCVEVTCFDVTVESDVGNTNVRDDLGFDMQRHRFQPFRYQGGISRASVMYGETEKVLLRVAYILPDDTDPYSTCDEFQCYFHYDPLLEVYVYPEIVTSAADRLGFLVDGKVFHISEADTGSGGVTFWWTNPGLAWADGDIVSIKLIENATATFDAASYVKDEGDSFDVTVTLSDSFTENTITVPIEVAGDGGADAADYMGIPENLVFAPGETQKMFTVEIVDDALDDDDESITISLAEEVHIKEGGAHEQTTITIRDDDDPEVEVSFEQAAYTVPEGGSQTVTVTLSADPERTVTIPLTTTD